jgi:hypothetical protein
MPDANHSQQVPTMPPLSLKLWLALGVAATTLPASGLPASAQQAPACDVQATLEAARADAALQGEAGEAGESGGDAEAELAEALQNLASDLAAADAALAAGRPDDAATLFGFALDESYHRVDARLRATGGKGFEPVLAALAEAARQRTPDLPARRAAASQAIDALLAQAPGAGTPHAQLDAGMQLLNRAVADWGSAVACGEIGDAMAAWQARAAAVRGLALMRGAAQTLQSIAPDSAAEMLREIEGMVAAMPAVPHEGAAAVEPSVLTAASSRALLAAGDLAR